MVTGFKYTEIQTQLGLTYTRVNHLISEAIKAIQTERHRAARLDIEGPPKARRLRELELKPPPWLKAAIGPPPAQSPPRSPDRSRASTPQVMRPTSRSSRMAWAQYLRAHISGRAGDDSTIAIGAGSQVPARSLR